MVDPPCPGCHERDARIAELEARLAELERFRRESAYLRDAAKADRDLRSLTGESRAMKAVRLAIQQVARTDSTAPLPGRPVLPAERVPDPRPAAARAPRGHP